MKKFIVFSVVGADYVLRNTHSGKMYNIRMTFFGLERNLANGDVIYLHKELFDESYEEFSSAYYFGPMNSSYGRKLTSSKDVDFCVVEMDGHQIYLKRFYG